MRVSSKTQYGLRILLYMVQQKRLNRLASGREIASRQGLNEPYLEQIMLRLKNAGLVTTVRGRNGGYKLAKDPYRITLLDVIEAFDGELNLQEGPGLEAAEAVASEAVWNDLTELLLQHCRGLSLAKIADRHGSNLDYVI